MGRETWVKYYSWGKEHSWEYTEGTHGWREHLGTRTSRSSVCCTWPQAKNHNSGHMTSQRTLWLSMPMLLCQGSPRVPLGHLSRPGWTLHRALLGMPRCPDHIIIPDQCELGLISMYVFWGKWDLFPTSILKGYFSLGFVFSFIYILQRKKRTLCACTHTLFMLSKLQLWPVLLRLECMKMVVEIQTLH